MLQRGVYVSLLCLVACSSNPAVSSSGILDAGKPIPAIADHSHQAWDSFRSALRTQDLEEAVQFFSPHVRDQYRAALSTRTPVDLPELGAVVFASEHLRQYEVTIDGEDYAVVMECYNEKCYITQF